MMALEQINVGNTINDGTGDDLRAAFIKINQNFQELDTSVLDTVNLGTAGAEVLAGITGSVANFRRLVAGTNIELVQLENTIVVNGSTVDSRFTITGDSSSLVAGNGLNLNILGANGMVVGVDANTSAVTITGGIDSLTGPVNAEFNNIYNIQTVTADDIVTDNINGFDYDAVIGRYVEGFDFGPVDVNSSSILDWVIRQVGVDMGTFSAPSTGLIDLGNIA